MNEKKIYDVLVIGAGPGGMTAAIYAKRSNLDVAFIEKGAPGGKVALTSTIENYPGFDSIQGFQLSLNIYNQTKLLEIEHIYGEVVSFDKYEDVFTVITIDNVIRYAKSIILATGMTEKKFGIPGEEAFYGRGISYCAICDGVFYKNLEVAVLGAGNSAFKEARFLATIAKKVYLVHRTDKFRADEIEVIQTKKIANIEILTHKEMKSFNGNKKIESITFINTKTKAEEELKIDGVFSFIGYVPITNYINHELVKLDNFYIISNNSMETFTKGIYAIGDVTVKEYRQIATAISDGAIAALEAKKYIENKNME